MTGDDATATPRAVVWRFTHLLRNAALGLAIFAGYVVANRLADDMTGTDGFTCLFVFAFPIGAWVIGSRSPTGAPGASIAVAAVLTLAFPGDAGPTAKSLTLALSVAVVVAMFACECGAALRAAASSRAGDPWSGGWYELAMRYRSREHAHRALVAIWSTPGVGPCFLERDAGAAPQQPVDVASHDDAGSLFGTCELRGHRIEAATILTAFDDGRIDLCFSLPVGALARVFPVGAWPFAGPPSPAWRDELDDWLRRLGERVFAAAPFDCALLGHEVPLDAIDAAAAGRIPERGWDACLMPRADGSLAWHPATPGAP